MLAAADNELHSGKFWCAGEQTMINHRTGKSTACLDEDLQPEMELDERNFTWTGLRRIG